MVKQICVVGAGVIGLSSAVRIQDKYPQCQVTIIADAFSPNTTSDGAAGMLGVYAVSNTPMHLLKKWAEATRDYTEKLWLSPTTVNAGVSKLSGYFLASEKSDSRMECTEVLSGLRDLTVEELNICPEASSGKFFTTFQVDCVTYLPWLKQRFCDNGGIILKRTLDSLDKLYGSYDIIVNCSGLRSHQLVSDKEIRPARGETIRVVAPWLRHFYLFEDGDETTYVIPGTKNVVLGGTYQINNWNSNHSKEDSTALWNRCVKLVPSLKSCKVDYQWVGLRPVRDTVRVEKEKVPSKNCWIIHNYGHGGSGITLHWGCAGDVVDLLTSIIEQPTNYSKL